MMNSSGDDANRPIKVVVAGGGTSGWLAAAGLSRLLGDRVKVSLVESEQIGRIGVGEATIPTLRLFHKLLGIDERVFMKRTRATLKLGIEFQNWGNIGDKYFHSFGVTGKGCWACDFNHFWLAAKEKGYAGDFGEYCVELTAAMKGKAIAGENSGINYAYHLDAGEYATFLKELSLQNGTTHIEGRINNVRMCPESGNITALELETGKLVLGDLFIDCSGFSAILIEGALKTGFHSYAESLPCDSAVAVQTELIGQAPVPYTRAIAHEFGWQWKIPLQHRFGNGMVFSSKHVSDDEVVARLLNSVEGGVISTPKVFKYQTGRRLKAWNKNCVAIGLAAGFLEPVESTSIHLAMSGVFRLLKLFPQGQISQELVDEFNTQFVNEMDLVRNFIVLHYHATQRVDSSFWRHCKTMEIPDFLANRIALYRETGVCQLEKDELFTVDSWVQVMLGQGIQPRGYHPIVDAMTDENLEAFIKMVKQSVDKKVAGIPAHSDFLRSYCSHAS